MPLIYIKTELGQSAFQNRSSALAPRQRSAFIMFDGKRGLAEILQATAGLGVTAADVDHLLALGLLASVTPNARVSTASVPPPSAVAAPASAQAVDGPFSLDSQARYLKAYPIATRLTAGMGLRGFRLNLAIEAAGDLEKLKALAPKIRDAVGPEKFKELENALHH